MEKDYENLTRCSVGLIPLNEAGVFLDTWSLFDLP